MTLARLLENVDIIELTANLDTEVSSLELDSRAVKHGSMFAAVPGLNLNRAVFVSQAMEAGAVCVLCEKPVGAPYIMVADARRALSRIAANYHGNPTSSMVIVGITGTKGKTTTSYLTKQVLEQTLGVSVGLIGTNEIIIGGEATESERTTPEAVELHAMFRKMLDRGITHAVMEVSSHALSLHRVSDVHFAVGAYTNLSHDHLDFYGDMDSYFNAKALLFGMCDRAVVNLDGARGADIAALAAAPVLTFSHENLDASLFADCITTSADEVRFTARYGGECADTSLCIPGMFSVENGLAALGIALSLGVSLANAASALRNCVGVKGRNEVVLTPAPYTVIIDYAHTPDSLEKYLAALRNGRSGKLWCVFGCGGDRDASKRPLMGAAVERGADVAIVTSDNPRSESPVDIITAILGGMTGNPIVIPDRREAIFYALEHAGDGDTVVLAGKGQETYQEINGVKHHMDEREIITDYFKSLEQ